MLALKLLGVWRWLKEALSVLWSLARRYPLHAALIASLCLSGWLWWRLNAERERVSELAALVKSERAAVAAAQSEAIAQQLAADTANEALQDERNRITSYVQNAAETARRNAVADYAGRMRIAPGCISPAIPASVPENPAIPDGETGASELVAITRDDLDTLTREAVQGAVRYEWMKSLIDSGQAVVVPDVEFGK